MCFCIEFLLPEVFSKLVRGLSKVLNTRYFLYCKTKFKRSIIVIYYLLRYTDTESPQLHNNQGSSCISVHQTTDINSHVGILCKVYTVNLKLLYYVLIQVLSFFSNSTYFVQNLKPEKPVFMLPVTHQTQQAKTGIESSSVFY